MTAGLGLSMSTIEVDRLSRTFNSLRAVDNISFTVEAGEIFGFLGHNGAGKTTTIRMLSGSCDPAPAPPESPALTSPLDPDLSYRSAESSSKIKISSDATPAQTSPLLLRGA